MTRLYGRALQGKRLVDKVPHGHWKTTTFICGLRYEGVTAPFVLDAPMDGPYFLAYVEQILAPTLKKGQIVFLDNVSTHKVDGVEEAIEARGARVVFLPAYSPDLNPIEQRFARLKAFLRKITPTRRTRSGSSARAAKANVAAPPNAKMNSRRLMGLPRTIIVFRPGNYTRDDSPNDLNICAFRPQAKRVIEGELEAPFGSATSPGGHGRKRKRPVGPRARRRLRWLYDRRSRP